jgi:hypothetical protein
MSNSRASTLLDLLFRLCHSPAAAAWACGTLDNGYGNKTKVCAPAACNAKQQNLGGDLLILDIDSFNQPMQGYNKPIPATCCQACQDTDGCNAWVLCTKQVRDCQHTVPCRAGTVYCCGSGFREAKM